MPFLRLPWFCLCLLALLVGCQVEPRSADSADGLPATSSAEATAFGGPERAPTEQEVEAARRDTAWRGFAMRDTDYPRSLGRPVTSPPDSSVAADRDAGQALRADTAAYAAALSLPLSADVEGRAVLYTQILLDRARFSPGQIDGKWGQNTEKAIYWLQRREGLDATGSLDRATLHRLVRLAAAPASPESLVVVHTLTADDVEGPFEETPEDIYAQAEMDRLVYQSLAEKLGEQFHVAPALLREWHGGSLDSLAAGDTLRVPNLIVEEGRDGDVVRLQVSDGGRYLHALGADGRILYHYPATLGSDYDPSPSDTLEILSVAHDPGWHYQPAILAGVDDSEEDAHIPPGPNNAVGVVWIELSKEHYGIHGTAHPETIGHTASAGCVRVTNWDAKRLADLVRPGTSVAFRDGDGRDTSASAADSTAASRP